jgi:hypothetical protein
MGGWFRIAAAAAAMFTTCHHSKWGPFIEAAGMRAE